MNNENFSLFPVFNLIFFSQFYFYLFLFLHFLFIKYCIKINISIKKNETEDEAEGEGTLQPARIVLNQGGDTRSDSGEG